MDPNATLAQLLDALADNDRDTAADAAHNLADWLDNDGFMPEPVGLAVVMPSDVLMLRKQAV